MSKDTGGTDMSESKELFSFEFISLNFVSFFAFCNLSVFYSFFTYLGKIGIQPEWRGFLVGLEPMTAFVLRLALVPLIHTGNGPGVMLASLVMIVIALCSYTAAVTIPALILLRIFHGAAFVLLVSASMSLVVQFIPKERSAQGFGIVTVAALAPYAVMPLLMESLLGYVHSEAHVYAAVSLLALPGIVLLVLVKPRLRRALGSVSAFAAKRPTAAELRENLEQPDVLLILVVNLLLMFSHSTVFFFMKEFSIERGIGDVGLFFPISTAATIAVRLVGGTLFDKANKLRLLQLSMLLLAICFGLMAGVSSHSFFYLLAVCYGSFLGVVMPLINAIMFGISRPQFRGINANLMLFMMDAAYFLSPYLTGLFLEAGRPVSALLHICQGLLLISVVLLVVLEWVKRGRLVGKTSTSIP